MELKEYLKILRKKIKLFLGIVLLFLLVIPSYFIFQSKSYEVSLNLDITRAGSQKSKNYKFDDFYRLQADEKFADTIVEWLKSPSVVSEIWEKAEQANADLSFKQLKKMFRANKVSSQVIAVNFSVKNKKEAGKIARAIEVVINKNTQELNKNQQQENWFEIIIRGPIVKLKSYNLALIYGLSLVAGLFFGFWIVLMKHYLE
jgi:capsular polysaccharide biosynthesis protein